MPKKIPEYRKNAIEEREAKGIKTRKRKKDYTDAQWATHLAAQKKKFYKEWYKTKGKEGYRKKLGYIKNYVIKKPIWWICDWCGSEFKKKPRLRGKDYNWQYCSQECAGKAFMQLGLERRKLKLAQEKDEKAKFVYQIVITDKYIQKKSFDKYITQEEAFDGVENLLNENKNILLPRKYFYLNRELHKANDELLLLKLEDDTEPSQFPNDYGKLIDNIVDSKSNWVIINKHKWNVEDKFHHVGVSTVKLFKSFGSDNTLAKYRDKEVKYILDNLIFDDRPIHIFIYDCYLILKYSTNETELIYAPHVNIIIELYKFLQGFCKKKKYNNITFMGPVDTSLKLCEIYDEVITNKLDTIYKMELERNNESKKNKNNTKSIECD